MPRDEPSDRSVDGDDVPAVAPHGDPTVVEPGSEPRPTDPSDDDPPAPRPLGGLATFLGS